MEKKTNITTAQNKMRIIKNQSIKNKLNEIVIDRGYNPGEIQISKSAIVFLNNFLNKELEDITNKALDYIIDYNKKYSSKKGSKD